MPPDSPSSVRLPPPLRWFFRPGARLPLPAVRVLLLVSLGLAFEQYDIGLLTSALPQIMHDLGIDTADAGYYLGAIRLGGIGTFLIVPFADRIGRRRVFLASLIGMSLGTLATGLSQTPLQLVLCQLLTRVFMLTGASLAVVILVEEFPAEHRGGAIGLLGLLGGVGFGLQAGLYAAIDSLPGGWRSLYGFGVAPLVALPFLRRSLRETRRFEDHRSRAGPSLARGLRDYAAPVLQLARTHPRRFAGVGLAGFFAAASGLPVFQFLSQFVQTQHGWSPGGFTLLIVGGGTIGILGNVLGGRGSDRVGRRWVAGLSFLVVPAFATLLYRGPESTVVLGFSGFVLFASAGNTVLKTVAAELFPTSQRGTSSGWLVAVETAGWSLSLYWVARGTQSFDDLTRMVAVVSVAAAFAGLCLCFVPETGARELEAISQEPSSAGPS